MGAGEEIGGRGPVGGDRAYNVSGNQGVLLELRSGKSVMLGSQRARELDEALTRAADLRR